MSEEKGQNRTFHLPEPFDRVIRALLEELGFPVSDPRRLAEAVVRLSDHYHAHPDAPTPWDEPWAQAASVAYYFPLNFARNQAVALEASRLGFFEGLTKIIDFGSGTGSALAAFSQTLLKSGRIETACQAYDISPVSLQLGQRLMNLEHYETVVVRSAEEMPPDFLRSAGTTLVIASYALTELEKIPSWWDKAEALAIIEPSTQEDGRRLMQTRADLIEKGYHIWAPCTHHGPCPLLTQSARDWCHDRVHWRAPDWFLEMERHLPMKNRTITHSYLLARRSHAPPAVLRELARLTGDTLVEKGKTRQSICRGPDREFLAWFPQRFPKGTPDFTLERGRLIRFKSEPVKKSSELRIQSPEQIEAIPADHEVR